MALGKDPARYRTDAGFRPRRRADGPRRGDGRDFIGFTAPENYQSILTFQIWTMLIVGGSGNNAGHHRRHCGLGILGASGLAIGAFVPGIRGARRRVAPRRDRPPARDNDRPPSARHLRRAGDCLKIPRSKELWNERRLIGSSPGLGQRRLINQTQRASICMNGESLLISICFLGVCLTVFCRRAGWTALLFKGGASEKPKLVV